jgi:hypothetical protein
VPADHGNDVRISHEPLHSPECELAGEVPARVRGDDCLEATFLHVDIAPALELPADRVRTVGVPARG